MSGLTEKILSNFPATTKTWVAWKTTFKVTHFPHFYLIIFVFLMLLWPETQSKVTSFSFHCGFLFETHRFTCSSSRDTGRFHNLESKKTTTLLKKCKRCDGVVYWFKMSAS
jgi:hypothetical protein